MSIEKKKRYNPKTHAPAVYIPYWLLQIPINQLSHQAKLLYGRLSQWSNSKGDVFRSSPQLADEIGVSERSIERILKELRYVGLIGTYQPQKGGCNHFEFYHHEWMDAPLICDIDPPSYVAVPPDTCVGTPPSYVAGISKKEVRISKKELQNTLSPNGESESFLEFWRIYPKKKARKTCARKWEVKKMDEIAKEVIATLKDQVINDDSWIRGFAPNPLTYLNQERWNDEIQRPSKNNNSSNWTFDSVGDA